MKKSIAVLLLSFLFCNAGYTESYYFKDCKKCIDERIESRVRRCPICRNRFSEANVKNIFWK